MRFVKQRNSLNKIAAVIAYLLIGIFIFAVIIPLVIAIYERIATSSWNEITGIMPFVDPKQEYYRGKTLWDLLDLLIIPLVLALGAFGLNQSARKVEIEIAKNRDEIERQGRKEQENETALQNYLDKMSQLILEQGLTKSLPENPIRDVARSRTLTVLRVLDGLRKGLLLRFLYEAELINKSSTVINLRGADLSGADLYKVNLYNANLSEVIFKGANLEQAILEGANLSSVNLEGTNLCKASLRWANLSEANLVSANLHQATVVSANFDLANLSNAICTNASIIQCKFSDANLNKVNLSFSNLTGTSFFGADLTSAKLTNAQLTDTNLLWADLTEADLTGATVTQDQLKKARSLENIKGIL